MKAADLPGVVWRKSSRSGNNANCVELGYLPAIWRKSSRSGDNANCVELGFAGRTAAVRDSKNQAGPALVFAAESLAAFLTAAKLSG